MWSDGILVTEQRGALRLDHINDANADNYNVSVLLQKGVYVKRTDAPTVLHFICSLLDIDPERAMNDIKTVMMDNKVVDDPSSERVGDAASLVLSGAMPGLVGAMLRSDSPYKAMRATITSASGTKEPRNSPMIEIRLFNTVLRNYAGSLVRHGFWIDDSDQHNG